MFIYVTTTMGTRVALNVSAITNFKKVSYNLTYIDYYAHNAENEGPFIIDRIETNEEFNSISQRITEALHNR